MRKSSWHWLVLAPAAALLLLIAPAQLRASEVPAPATEALAWLRAGAYAALEKRYAALQRDYESGAVPERELYRGFRQLYEEDNEQLFDGWVHRFPQSYPARLARGVYLYRMAWYVRGEKYLAETPVRQVLAMSSYLGRARPDLLASMQLTRKPYLSTLYLLNAAILDSSDEERRHWLDVGTALDPGNFFLRSRYMFSLMPRWGGSYEAMQAFLDECRQQRLPAPDLARLATPIFADMAETQPEPGDPAIRYDLWGHVLTLARSAGDAPSEGALIGYARAAWDLHRRADADRALDELAQHEVHDARALSQMGWIYTLEGRQPEAWPRLLRAAELQDPWAQFAVGKTLYQGCAEIHLAADRRAGLEWVRRAAEQGFPEARSFLASASR